MLHILDLYGPVAALPWTKQVCALLHKISSHTFIYYVSLYIKDDFFPHVFAVWIFSSVGFLTKDSWQMCQ